MAQKLITVYTDDLTGAETTEIDTYTLLLNGVGVELDLSPDSHDQLLEALNPFLGSPTARRVRGTSAVRSRTRKAPAATGGTNTSEIRSWAKANGYEVNDRGRVPASVKEAYEKANK